MFGFTIQTHTVGLYHNIKLYFEKRQNEMYKIYILICFLNNNKFINRMYWSMVLNFVFWID